MPVYEYICPQRHVYAEERRMVEEQKVFKCPTCGQELSRVFSSGAVIFKGKGFYSTGG